MNFFVWKFGLYRKLLYICIKRGLKTYSKEKTLNYYNYLRYGEKTFNRG